MASNPQEFDSGLQNDVPSSNTGYLAFVEAVFCNVAGFFCLKRDIFVVQGWNGSQGRATKEWYHLQLDRSSPKLEPVCLCPIAKLLGECVHQDFFNEFEVENPASYEGQKDDVILFCRDLRETDSVNLFSVASAKNPHLVKSRKIVAYTGDDRGTGCWTCTADSGNSCVAAHRANVQQIQPVSYLPIAIPTWAAIDSDVELYPQPLPITKSPEIIPLSPSSRCACGILFDPAKPTVTKNCLLYSLTEPLVCSIQLQKCQKCNTRGNRYIGPDSRQLGIFNYNNRLLFAHDLLDEYTMEYTSSETPFVAWVHVVSRRYAKYAQGATFVDEGTFRKVWFDYARLVNFSNDMACPKCGPCPSDVIWDGITLGFNQKHLLPTLYPPTTLHPNSIERRCSYPKKQTLVLNKDCRKLLQSITTGPSLVHDDSTGNVEESEDSDASGAEEASLESAKQLKNILQRVQKIPELEQLLTAENTSLASLFTRYSGSAVILAKIDCPRPYRKFFQQISTSDSILQIVNRPALRLLQEFIANPRREVMENLLGIPCLYHVIQFEYAKGSLLPKELLGVLQWIAQRTMEVLDRLLNYPVPPEDPSANGADNGWEKVRHSIS
ncbi:hypothetical protein FPV67DRAFT_1416127 [Lyophyllum atratum]|nr:hypothetical protein FPV67DRAFT_1422135 [Lyophyllum atratum]KAF8067539.1 hypothetical protein FPV67DRAFT_1416127 [Lyophyllum atratum]